MKIGLVGAPGSGKTALAEALASAFGGLAVIDGYVDELEVRTNYVYGQYATYAGNIAIGLDRHFRERQAARGYVTCGTMLDTVTYQAVKVQVAPDEQDHRRLTGGLVTLGCMVEDMMDYDHLFYLPSQPEDTFLAAVAMGVEEALDIFGSSFATLDQATLEERVASVLAHVEWDGS